MKVLLVDDDRFALKLHTRLLVNYGFGNVVAHEHATDAVALLEGDNQAFDLILCDLQMPGMDGVEFIRQLVRLSYAGALVLVSGEDARILQTAEKLSRAHRLNVLGALKKPVSPEQLQQVLKNHHQPAAMWPAARKTYAREALSQAISGDELVNYYQPKVDLGSGMVTGVETLVRWHHPVDGLVYPDQFIGMAEETGLIADLTRIVLSGALDQARIWQDAGLHLSVAVNVSMDNLISLEFPDFVAQAVHQAGVPPTSLMLEVTESRLMNDPLMALDILTRLRLKRISLSIDDFGTGHSSLAQLRDIPFDELKVDRSFVHGVGRDPSLRALFEASLGMARQLGMKTVAEGVEDREDWDFLRLSRCDTAQGYFIAKPMPAAELPSWIEGWGVRYRRFVTSGSS
ncbi:MAG: EAL domain-containing response regulator [Rhodoferax sp.]|uniref:EAL domain-containing response regulator n=1 Tax=Rhodoferax sp. TaxID=50421 RepID=UPI00273038CE|nr:EAL domain-containing response regulator [Rhodoferax sp.]MDP1529142.1 EAL domain-containing response regulator [Rhodoferax sp.]MDP1942764.1 EAL domain-containing response regulator [Rhodoferax sp.]